MGNRPRPSAAAQAEFELLQRCRAGDESAFQPLLRPHLTGLLSLAQRHCRDAHWAEDLVQETLVRAFRNLHSFRGDAALRTWLYRILVRLAGAPQRWRRDERAAPLDEVEIPSHFDALPEEDAIARELQDRLDEAMERLTFRQRTALHLRAVEGMDYAAIADVLACTAVAARMHVLAARRHVLRRVEEHLDP